MWKQFANGTIKKKILPGSDIHNMRPKPELKSNQPQYSHVDEHGRNYVNTGFTEYDKENDEYNEVLLFISFYLNKISNFNSIL